MAWATMSLVAWHINLITELIKDGYLCGLSAYKVADDAIIDASQASSSLRTVTTVSLTGAVGHG